MNGQEFCADLHIHSRFSRATSGRLNAPHLAAWAALKGITVLGTGDFTHPEWRAELEAELRLDENSGLYALKDPGRAAQALPEWADIPFLRSRAAEVRFILQGEISSIYKRGGKTRKIHNLVFMPRFEEADRFCAVLGRLGNLESDGRPILGLDCQDLLDSVLHAHDEAFLIPAHIWTPWFSLFGSKSGFDSLEECFGALAGHIFALETGLSSDPDMNRRLSALDGFKLVSNSDAHSGEKLAREVNIFSGELSYTGLLNALRSKTGQGLSTRFMGTCEFFSDEGKYYHDGHRACKVSLSPEETRALGGICPVCGKAVTLGVLYRVQELADRAEAGYGTAYGQEENFVSIIPLSEIAGEVLRLGPKSKKSTAFYQELLTRFGPELEILRYTPLESIAKFSAPLAQGIDNMRKGKVCREAGYDGEFGVISVFSPEERKALQSRRVVVVGGQKMERLSLLPEQPAKEPVKEAAAVKAALTAAAVKAADSTAEVKTRDGRAVPRSNPVECGLLPFEPAGAVSKLPATPGAAKREEPAAGGEPAPPEPAARPPELNSAQLKAAQAGPHPILVIAGPGTGKTHTLIARVLHLLKRGVAPRRILAVTFTRRAARELDERLRGALPEPSVSAGSGPGEDKAQDYPRVATLHSLALEFWMTIHDKAPVLLTEETAARVFAEANQEESRQRCRQAFAAINLSREKLEPVSEEWRVFFENYTQYKTAWNLADYTDLLDFWLTQAKSGLFSRQWSEILVDEVQDLSPLQLSLTQALLPAEGTGFFGIGDPDQSIYSFRGAHGQADSFFKAAWPQLKRIQLAENYRSAPEILSLAQTLFGQSQDKIITAKRAFPWDICFFEAKSAEKEATWIAEMILRFIGSTSHSLLDAQKGRGRRGEEAGALAGKSYSPADIAVLTRSRPVMTTIRRALDRAGIPVSQPIADPFWNEPRIIKILEVVARLLGIGISLIADSRKGARLECPDWVLARGPSCMADFWRFKEPFDVQFWKSDSFKNFARAFEVHQGWFGLFNWLSLQNEQELALARSEQVRLLTLHAAKGLEFPLVFMPALEDGILPYLEAEIFAPSGEDQGLARQIDNGYGNEGLNWGKTGGRGSGGPLPAVFEDAHLAEEKRLFYVGLTRAREGLFLSRAEKRRLYGRELRLKPSRFLARLPVNKVRHSAEVAKHKITVEHLSLF
ncbi:MAG: UvrD-helicase domain-containing protein [Deltaproteobacteria bacterium]|jgi:uncharacterized protein (TIGR00375 family)|nr:UvrD-helicase domain-containing protein [Deltaproteobacteria bacterium]